MFYPFYVFYDVISPKFTEFLKFILTQDPIKIAVGVTLAYAVSKLVSEINVGVLTPLIKIITKSKLNFTIKGVEFDFGKVLEQIILLILILVVIYFLIIVPINKLKQKYNIDQQTLACPYCTTLINPGATRCPACTSIIGIIPSSSSENEKR